MILQVQIHVNDLLSAEKLLSNVNVFCLEAGKIAECKFNVQVKKMKKSLWWNDNDKDGYLNTFHDFITLGRICYIKGILYKKLKKENLAFSSFHESYQICNMLDFDFNHIMFNNVPNVVNVMFDNIRVQIGLQMEDLYREYPSKKYQNFPKGKGFEICSIVDLNGLIKHIANLHYPICMKTKLAFCEYYVTRKSSRFKRANKMKALQFQNSMYINDHFNKSKFVKIEPKKMHSLKFSLTTK